VPLSRHEYGVVVIGMGWSADLIRAGG